MSNIFVTQPGASRLC